MINFLKFIGCAIYSLIMSYIMWLLFYFINPWIMSFGWVGLILYTIFATGLISSVISIISTLVFSPMFYLINNKIYSKIIPVIIFVLYGISTSSMPWELDINYSLVKIIIALSLTITSSVVFITFIFFTIAGISKN